MRGYLLSIARLVLRMGSTTFDFVKGSEAQSSRSDDLRRAPMPEEEVHSGEGVRRTVHARAHDMTL